MTNWEKFKEVFGITGYDRLTPKGSICAIIDCSDVQCRECPLYEQRGLLYEGFWEEEYNEEREG
jgi:hypothetical protein